MITNKNYGNLEKCFDEALEIFAQHGKNIEGIHDLIVRGTRANSSAKLKENWSDLDLSIVIDSVSFELFSQIKKIYQVIKHNFPYKLSITTVSVIDFYHPYHHHGVKPLVYNFSLENSCSLFDRTFAWRIPPFIGTMLVDSFSHCAYLIHELRNRCLSTNLSCHDEMEVFFPHMLKRTKHFFRDALFIMTGNITEEINFSLFGERFISIYPGFPEKLKYFQKKFLSKKSDKVDLLMASETLFNAISSAYDTLIMHVTELTKRALP